MKWIRILLFMSLLLAAVNGYLLYSIHNMYRSVNYLDEEMITDTVELLSRSGIDVSPRIIPEKITQRQVWEGSLGESWEEYCLQAAMLLSGSRGTDRFSLHMMVNGLNVTDTESGDRFAFYDSDLFSFRFLGGGREEFTPAAEGILSGELPDGLAPLNEHQRESAARTVAGLLDFSGEEGFTFTAEQAWTDGQFTYVLGSQRYAGEEIHGCRALFLLESNKILWAGGRMLFARVEQGYRIALYDQLNILFYEKQSAAARTDGETGQPPRRTIENMETLYGVSWNSEHTTFYLIPSWRLVYADGEHSVRSALSGGLYTN